jgi:hypothetical protein
MPRSPAISGPLDEQRFDAITEAIGATASRRAMFRALVGVALAMIGTDALAEDPGTEKKNVNS